MSEKNHMHQVYMENYFSSSNIPLFSQILKMQIFATAVWTFQSKRRREAAEKKPGTTQFSSHVCLVYAAWFGKRPVQILSNYYKCHLPVGEFTVDHWYTAKKGELVSTTPGKFFKQISICSRCLFLSKVDIYGPFSIMYCSCTGLKKAVGRYGCVFQTQAGLWSSSIICKQNLQQKSELLLVL